MRKNKLILTLKKYYSNGKMRTIIDIIYIISQISLALYLLFIPIQIAYFWLLKKDNRTVQIGIDGTVSVLFFLHICLYFDDRFLQILKNPYANWMRKIVTLELIYDILCLILAIYSVTISHSLGERIIELVFFLKITKLVKFDIKCMSVVVGTVFYTPYKVFRTLLIVFMAIAYVGSLFYGVAYYLYTQDSEFKHLLWIVKTGAIQDCVGQPFIIQLEYAMYWALGTASTAAYGDISAAEPMVVLINIFALAFEGFLFGFYLNSMHSIPAESSQKESDLLQKFDSFQQHSSNRKLDDRLYLQILCSLQYSQSKKRSLGSVEKLMPKKYIQELKFNMYAPFLNSSIAKGFLPDSAGLEAASHVKETICELAEDIYSYKSVQFDDLVYVKEGVITNFITGQISLLSTCTKSAGSFIGFYQFLTGLNIPQQAICTNYCSIYSLERRSAKLLLKNDEDRLNFYQRSLSVSLFLTERVMTSDPIMNFIASISDNQSQVIVYDLIEKVKKKAQKIQKSKQDRKAVPRGSRKSEKVQALDMKTRSTGSQTDPEKEFEVDQAYIWSSKMTRSLFG